MNSEVTNGPWGRFRIQLRRTWNELTNEDLDAISRDRDDLVHVVQRRYRCKPVEVAPFSRIGPENFAARQALSSPSN